MLVSATEMLKKAVEGHYAVGQFNINNLEWTKAILLTAQENNSPVILGVSEGTAKNLVKYFSSDPNNYSSKMYEVENWNKLRQQEDAAREAAKPIKRTVVIAKAN